MFPILPIALAGGAILAGVQLRKKPQPLLITVLTESKQPANPQRAPANIGLPAITTLGAEVHELTAQLYTRTQDMFDLLGWSNGLTSVRNDLEELDEAAARFTQTRFERWLYKDRQEQLAALTPDSEAPAMSLPARTIYRELNLAFLGAAMMVGGFVLQPWLLVPAVALDIYLIRDAYKGLRHALFVERRVNATVLFAVLDTVVITAGLFIARAYLLIYAIIVPILLVTQIFKLATEDHARRNLTTIFGLRRQTVWVVQAGVEVEQPLARVQAGDVVVVYAGEVIPVDGIIQEGMATIDQHVLTGEAQPAEKGPGEPVFATTVVLSGKLLIGVEKAGDQTVAAQIAQILDRTTDYRTTIVSRTQALADQVALPLLCAGAFAFPMVGIPGTLAVLNSSTSLFYIYLLGHLGVLNFLNRAAHHGILVKDGRALERLPAVDTVVFDKTGTLTLEQPTVVAVHRYTADYDETKVLTYAAAAEHRQNHPIAQAILAAAQTRHLPLPAIDQASYKIGYGIEVSIDGVTVRVGSARLMALHQLPLPHDLQALLPQSEALGHSLVLVAMDQQVVGAIELQPTLRPEAKAVVAALRQRGVKTCHIISGDQAAPTQRLAEALGMDSYSAQTLPEQKAEIISRMQAEGKVICYIGDGINDAIALKAADISVSLRGASALAMDTAQIILMSQNLHQLTEVFDLATDFNRHMNTCFGITLTPGVVTIFGAFFLHFGIISSIVLNQLSLWTGVAHAMSPARQIDTAPQAQENQNEQPK